MKAAELRSKNVNELRELLGSLRKESFNLRTQKAASQLENTARVKTVRREIAKVKTVMAEQRLTKLKE